MTVAHGDEDAPLKIEEEGLEFFHGIWASDSQENCHKGHEDFITVNRDRNIIAFANHDVQRAVEIFALEKFEVEGLEVFFVVGVFEYVVRTQQFFKLDDNSFEFQVERVIDRKSKIQTIEQFDNRTYAKCENDLWE